MICDEGVSMPRRATKDSAGYDVYAPMRMVLNTRWQTFDMGFRFEPGDIPEGCVALMVTRSSTGAKHGVHIRNPVGVIDHGYYQNVRATLSVDESERVYERGERVLQFIIVPFITMKGEIPPEDERNGGYGSTGA